MAIASASSGVERATGDCLQDEQKTGNRAGPVSTQMKIPDEDLLMKGPATDICNSVHVQAWFFIVRYRGC